MSVLFYITQLSQLREFREVRGDEAQNLQRHCKQKFYDKHLSENRVKSTNCNFVIKYASIAKFYKNVSISTLQHE